MQSSVGNCGKCGICLAVCPVYKVLREEQASPRARIQLIKAYTGKTLPSSPVLKELISKCLMCGSCAAHCPSGVDHYAQFMEMRAKMIADHGDRLEIRGLVYLLAKEQRLRLAMSMAGVGQRQMPEMLQKKMKLGNIWLNKYPAVNKKAFRAEVPEEIAPEGKERGTVLYFTGCATNYIFAETGFSTLRLLSKLGYRVIIPRKQTCCSIPMLFHGGVEQARENIVTNVRCLQHDNVEAIIVDCPTCGSALKQEFPRIMRKYGLDDTAALKIAALTIDVMSFVDDRLDLLEFMDGDEREKVRVSYHLPCHLKNASASSESVLQKIPTIEYVATADTGECCGGGGTFFYEYPEVSSEIAQSKIDNFSRVGAKVWLTDCPVCRINLSGQLHAEDDVVMMHPVTCVAERLRD